MVKVEELTTTEISLLTPTAGRLVYDKTINKLKIAVGTIFKTITDSTSSGGNVGINTTAVDYALEVNSSTGSNLRLTYNDMDGSAINYCDLFTTSNGNFTITPSGGIVNITAHNGSTQGLSLNNILITASANELNYNTGVVAGTALASKTLVVDGSKNITSINNLTANNIFGSIGTATQSNITSLGTLIGLTVSGSTILSSLTLGSTLLTATASEINLLSSVIGGTVLANKVVIVDSNKDISGFRNITITGSITELTLLSTISFTLNGISVTSTANELNYLSGISVGVGSANKTLVLDSSRNISNINVLTATNITGTLLTAVQPNITSVGTLTNLTISGTTTTTNIIFGGTTITATAVEINRIGGVTPGTVIASKAIITDSSKDISGIRNITCSSGIISGVLNLQTLSITLNSVTIDAIAVEINRLAGITTGLVSAEKVVVPDQFRNISNFNSVSSATFTGLLQTAAQPNITSVGTLSTLTVSGNLIVSGHNGTTTGLTLSGTLVTANGSEINRLAGVTAGTVTANKVLVVDSNKDLSSIRNLTITGTLSLASITLGGILVTANGTELNYNTSVTAGIASSGKTVVLDSNADFTGIRNLELTNNLTTVTLTLNGTLVTATGAEINTLSGVTPGTVTAGKLISVDSNKDIFAFRNLTLSNLKINGSTSGTIILGSSTGSWSLTLPTSAGSSGYLLQTDGTGVTSWVSTNSLLADIIDTTGVSITVTPSTISTSSSTGSLIINGGVGIAKNIKIGNNNLLLSSWLTSGAQYDSIATTFTNNSSVGSSTVSSAVITSFARPTISATNSNVTTTTAATVYIANSPASGSNMTITNSYSLWVPSGNILFDANTTSSSTTTGTLVITGGLGVSGTINATSFAGTITTVTQNNITSVGTLTSLTVSGTTNLTGLFQLSGSSVTASATQLNYLSSAIPGTAAASKALVLDASANISGINILTASSFSGTIITSLQNNITSVGTLTSLTVSGTANITGSLQLNSITVNSNANEINVLNTVSAGTVTANKALVVNSSKMLFGITSLGFGTSTDTTIPISSYNTTTGNIQHISIGNSTGLNNASVISFNFTASGSTSNYIGFGFKSNLNLIILDAAGNLNIANHDGSSIGLKLNNTLVTATGSQLNFLSGVTAGTASAGKSLVLDSSANISGINILSATTLTGLLSTTGQTNITSLGTLTSLSVSGIITFGGTAITSTATEINYLAGVTPGTITASKAFVANSVGNINDINIQSTATIGDLSGNTSRIKILNSGGVNYIQSGSSSTSGSSADLYFGNINTLVGGDARSFVYKSTGLVGIGKTTPNRQLEINNSTGGCLRLSYNAPTVTATNYTDLLVASDGTLDMQASSGIIRMATPGSTNYTNFTITSAGNLTISQIGTQILNISSTTFNISSHNGSTTGLQLNGTLVTSTAIQLNFLSGVTAGTALASRALVLDSSSNITGISTLSATSLSGTLITGAQPNIVSLGNLSSNLTVGGANNTDISIIVGTTLTSAGGGNNGRIVTLVSSGVGYIQAGTSNDSGASMDLFIGNMAQNTSTSSRKFMIKANGNVGIGISLPTFLLDVAGTTRITGITSLTNGTTSTSITTGSLVVTGGVGISTALFATTINGVTSVSTPSLLITGSSSGTITVKGAAIAGTWTLTLPTSSGTNGYLLQTDGNGITTWVTPPTVSLPDIIDTTGVSVTITTTTAATSATSAGFIVSGGVGIAKNVIIADTTASTSATSGAIVVSGGIGTNGRLTSGDTTYATNASSGSIVIAGGIGITKNIAIGGGTISSVSWLTSGIQYNSISSTFTNTSTAASGTAVSAVISSFATPTITATNTGVTTSTASTVYIAGSPQAGTNMTITNSYSLWVASGKILFADTTVSTSITTGALVISGGIGVAGTVSATSLAGSITTPSQGNITSLGTLTGLTVSGITNLTGTFQIAGSTVNSTAAQLNFLSGVTAGSALPSKALVLDSNNSILAGINQFAATAIGANISPSYPLDVNGNARISNTLFFGTSTDNTRIISALSNMAANTTVYFTLGAANSIANQGELGFTYVSAGSASNRVTLGVFGSQIIYATGANNVGINNSTPAAPLHVSQSRSFTLLGSTFAYGKVGGEAGAQSGSRQISAIFDEAIAVVNAVYVSSDVRLKTDILPLTESFCKEFIKKTNPVSFTIKSNNDLSYGYIAQEIQKAGYESLTAVIPNNELGELIDGDNYVSPAGAQLQLSYEKIIPILAKNIEIIYNEKKILEDKLENQQNIINNLLERIIKLEQNDIN